MATLRRTLNRILLVSILASPLPLWGQANPQDVIVPPAVELTQNLGTNLSTIGKDVGGWQRNWILTPPSGYSFACVSIFNQSPVNLIYYLDALTPSSPSVTGLVRNENKWQMVPVQTSGGPPDSEGFAASPAGKTGFLAYAKQVASVLVTLPGAGRLALVPTFIAGADTTVDWSISFNNTGICGPVNYSVVYWADIAAGVAADRIVYPVGSGKTLGLGVNNAVFFTDATTFSACRVLAKIVNTAGAAPTLNLYVQDHNSNNLAATLFDDRISFTQFAGVGATQLKYASIVHTITVDHALSQGALAANTEAGSMFTKGIRLFYHLSAGSTYNVYVFGACSR